MCLASQNNHPTSLASSWDSSFLKSLVQQDPKGSNKVAHHFILDVYDSPNRKCVNLSIIYYIVDFSFFMSQDDAYFHIHQNDPTPPCNLLHPLYTPFTPCQTPVSPSLHPFTLLYAPLHPRYTLLNPMLHFVLPPLV